MILVDYSKCTIDIYRLFFLLSEISFGFLVAIDQVRGLQCWNLWASIAWRKMSRKKQQNVKQNVTWCRLVTQQGLLKFRALQAWVVYRNVTYSYVLVPVDHIDHSAKCSRYYQLEIKAVLRCRLILPCLVSKRLKLQHSASVRASVRIDWYLPHGMSWTRTSGSSCHADSWWWKVTPRGKAKARLTAGLLLAVTKLVSMMTMSLMGHGRKWTNNTYTAIVSQSYHNSINHTRSTNSDCRGHVTTVTTQSAA